jgi:hypothetical protein
MFLNHVGRNKCMISALALVGRSFVLVSERDGFRPRPHIVVMTAHVR